MPVGTRARVVLGGAALLTLLGATLVFAPFTPHDRIAAVTSPPAPAGVEDRDALLRHANLSRGESLFGQCAACHSIGRAAVDLDGPNLYGVVGRAVASRRPRYAYTAALRQFGGLWSPARLDAWLTDPAAVVPHTKMVFAGLQDARDRADVIAYLNSQGSNLPLP